MSFAVQLLLTVFVALTTFIIQGSTRYVDNGNPYKDGVLQVGELTLSESIDKSPLHTKVYFPIVGNQYPAVYFISGWNTKILAEFYEIFLSKVASHGFVVFGVDYEFPILDSESPEKLEDDIDKFNKQLQWLKTHMTNRTTSTILWDDLALMCHSAGCDSTLKMIYRDNTISKATIFLEPYSTDVTKKISFKMPALMYGTQLSKEGFNKCAKDGLDWNQFYSIWTCPKIKIEVANFGHCDILDPEPWEACHAARYCKTTNDTAHLPEYRQFVQGMVSGFLMSELQGRPQDFVYITDRKQIPLPLLQLQTDLNCTSTN